MGLIYVDPHVNVNELLLSFNFAKKFQEITYVSQIFITILAYVHNFLLIFIIHRSPRRDIGSYRFLLTYFALSDIYYNTVHCVVFPVRNGTRPLPGNDLVQIPETFDNGFMMRGHGLFNEYIGVGLYTGAYAHAFPILIFHFLYRLLAIN